MLDTFEHRVATLFDPHVWSGEGLFFVQGFWRSGTSWVGRMLGGRPEVYVSHYELQTFMRHFEISQFGRPLAENPFLADRYKTCRKAGFLSILLHLHRVEKPGATLIGERSPGGDVVLLKQAFPKAKIVIVLRDGRDICVSTAFQAMMTIPGSRPFEEGDGDQLALAHIEGSARIWAQSVPEWFAVKAAHPDDILLIRYEELRADTQRALRSIFDFLGVPTTDAILDQVSQTHAFAREAQRPVGQEDRRSLLRKGVVGDWPHHFSPEGVALFERIAGLALKQAGYSPDSVVDSGPAQRPATENLSGPDTRVPP